MPGAATGAAHRGVLGGSRAGSRASDARHPPVWTISPRCRSWAEARRSGPRGRRGGSPRPGGMGYPVLSQALGQWKAGTVSRFHTETLRREPLQGSLKRCGSEEHSSVAKLRCKRGARAQGVFRLFGERARRDAFEAPGLVHASCALIDAGRRRRAPSRDLRARVVGCWSGGRSHFERITKRHVADSYARGEYPMRLSAAG